MSGDKNMRNVIVGFSELCKAIDMSHESTANEIRASIEKTTPDPASADAMQGEFELALNELEKAASEVDPELFFTPDNRIGSLLQTFLAEKAEEKDNIEESVHGNYEAKFAHNDILGWAFSLFDWIRGFKDHKMLRPQNTEPTPLPNSARFAVLGDWGTALYGAPVIADTIEKSQNPFTVLLHLGDVYYSGTEKEVETRFLSQWPKQEGAISRALNSNHEMYSGGYGYFKLTLPQFKQESSYFALQNDSWTFIGLDTGYTDHDLDGEQVEWVEEVVANAGNRKIVLSSHHQPFSWLEDLNTALIEKLGPLLRSKKIFAWYWGHEHRCVVYDKHPIYDLYGRCIGHSGMPYGRSKVQDIPVVEQKGRHIVWRRAHPKGRVPGALFLDGPNPYLGDKKDKYGSNGYLTLEFEGEHLREIYHTPDGDQILEIELA